MGESVSKRARNLSYPVIFFHCIFERDTLQTNTTHAFIFPL